MAEPTLGEDNQQTIHPIGNSLNNVYFEADQGKIENNQFCSVGQGM